MRLGYAIPRDWSYAIENGDWLATDAGDPAYLCDRSPGERTFFTWPAGAQTTSTTCSITFGRAAAFVPGLAMLLNTSLPLGAKVTLLGKRPEDLDYTYDLGGNTSTARVVSLPGGGRGVVWIPAAGLDPTNEFRAVHWNDVNGAASIAAESIQSDGELVAMPAIMLRHETGPGQQWSERRVIDTLGAQSSVSGKVSNRIVTVRSALLTNAEAHNGALDGTDVQAVFDAIADDPFVLAVLYPDDVNAHRSAVFGVISGLSLTGQPGRYQRTERLSIKEVPSK